MSAVRADAAAKPLGAALSSAAEVVASSAGVLWRCPDPEISEAVGECAALIARAQGLLLSLVSEADSRGVPARDGAPTTAAWVRSRLRCTPRDARQWAGVATATRGPMSATGAALSEGRLNLAQAAAVCDAVRTLPVVVADELRQRVEADLIERAEHFDAVQLARLGRGILSMLAPEIGAELEAAELEREEKRAAAKRELWIFDAGDGSHVLRGRLDSEGAALVRAALDPLSAPRPADADGPDRRTAATRRADALVELARRALASGEVRGRDGQPAQVVVTVGLRSLTDALGSATTADGQLISPALARRMACDAEIIPAVLGSAGAVLDVGRAQRLFSGARRRALVLRDRGCSFPECDRPPDWCEGHHIVGWYDGGTTSLGGGVLLCGHHHSVIHRGHWVVRLAADGLPEFVPPPWVDPQRRPRRSPRHLLRATLTTTRTVVHRTERPPVRAEFQDAVGRFLRVDDPVRRDPSMLVEPRARPAGPGDPRVTKGPPSR